MRLVRRPKTLVRLDLRFVRTLQSPDQVVYDSRLKRWRVSSAAFGPSSVDGSLSGDLEELLEADGLPPDALYPAVARAVGASTFTIREANALGVTVGHEPVWTNWYHGGARFPGMNTSVVNKAKKRLQGVAQDFIPIDSDSALRWYREKNNGQLPPGHPPIATTATQPSR
ncbi:MAG TPA: hypothetical protein VME40_06535, partial [Caulobacteraceae bacterium]|nr:hypothetical protein [Caulobacteraceae bacterium]